MAETWKQMVDSLAVVATAGACEASFVETTKDELTISVKKLKTQEPLLVAMSQPHGDYWCQAATVGQNGELTVSLCDFDQLWQMRGDTHWNLYLGTQTPNGVILSRLKGNVANRSKDKDGYFADARGHYEQPASKLTWGGSRLSIVPFYEGRNDFLSLLLTPEDAIYTDCVSCRLSELTRLEKDNLLHVVIECPKTLEQPAGVAFHSVISMQPVEQYFEGEPVGSFDETHQIYVNLPLESLRGEYGEQELVCILWSENGVPMRVPIRLGAWKPALAIQSEWEFLPLADFVRKKAYLFVTDDHRVTVDLRDDLPATQVGTASTLDEWLNDNTSAMGAGVTGVHYGGHDWQWKLLLPTLPLHTMDEALIVLNKLNSQDRLICPIVQYEAQGRGYLVTVDISALQTTVENCLPTDWFACVALRKGTSFWYLPVNDPRHVSYEKTLPPSTYAFASDFNRDPIGQMSFAGQTEECYLHWARKYGRQMCLRLSDQCQRHTASFVCRAEEGTLRFGTLTLKIRCPKVEGKWTGLVLTHRYKLEADRKDYFIPYTALKDCGKYQEMTVSVKIRSFTFTPLYWDLRAVFEQDGISFWSPVRAPIRDKKNAIRSVVTGLFFGESMVLDKNYQLFLYRTQGNRFALVCQERSPYSGFLFRLKERFAMLLYKLFQKRLHQENILLTYEKYCCMAQDNGFYFFKHCMDNHLEQQLNRKIYFVIDKKSVDYQKNLLPYQDHVIQFMSLKHMIYLQAARLLVSSDSKAHAYAWRCKESIIQPRMERTKKLVFLQHGVIALKKVEFFRSGTNVVDIFVTSNDREHDIIINELGYQPHEVIVTGLARWDVLKDTSQTADKKTILIMPTWRNWLEEVSDETFKQSDYYQNYMELLNSPRLAEYLEKYNLYLNFYIHPKFREYIGNFSISGDRVRLIPFGTEPLNELMMACSMLITDYSSVCWDVYYQAKPVLFYQFDLKKYNETQGAYIDLKTELFGDRAENNEELFALMEEEAELDFQLKPKYAEMRRSMYKYIDRNNSQRVIDEIVKRNW